MFFKNSILLLSIILAGNTALDQSGDEILKESYNVCKKWAKKTENELVSLNDFWLYMGKNSGDHLRIMTYFDKSNLPQGIIKCLFGKQNETRGLDLNNFCILFKEVCQERRVDVKVWAESRKDLAAKRTIEDTLRLQPAQTDDGAPTTKFALSDSEKEILNESFDDCRKWVTPNNEPVNTNIGIREFCCYMGLSMTDAVLSGFFLDNPEVKNPDLAQSFIDLNLFSEMFKYICDQNKDVVKDVASFRKNQAAHSTLKECLVLP